MNESKNILRMACVLCGVVIIVLFVAACSGPTITTTSGSQSQAYTVNVKVVKGQDNATVVLLPVMIHGHGPFTFALDTGASISLIALSLVRRFGLQVTGSSQAISGIGGVQQATPVSISNWSTGSIHLPSAVIVTASIPHERGGGFEGLLGSDIWSRFGKVTLDYSGGTLTRYKQIATSSDSLAAISSGRVRVVRAVAASIDERRREPA